jgi:hypothetical protein
MQLRRKVKTYEKEVETFIGEDSEIVAGITYNLDSDFKIDYIECVKTGKNILEKLEKTKNNILKAQYFRICDFIERSVL